MAEPSESTVPVRPDVSELVEGDVVVSAGVSRRLMVLAALVAVAFASVVVGCALIWMPSAWLAGGVLCAGWAWLFFGEAGE